MIDFLNEIIAQTNTAMVVVYAALWIGFFIFLYFCSRAFLTYSWPSVSGRVLRSNVKTRQRLAKNGGKTTLYDVELTYEYVVAQRTYSGSMLRFFDIMTNSRAYADMITSKHPKGSDIEVFFNKTDPESSVIYPGISSGVWMFVLFFVLSIGSMTAVFLQKLS